MITGIDSACMEAYRQPAVNEIRRGLSWKTRKYCAELILNRPAVLNAENWPMADAFHAALDDLEKSAEIRAVVVTGKGLSFSSGVDLRAFAGGNWTSSWFRSFDEAMRRLEQLDALTVAKIRGYAIGGGLQISAGLRSCASPRRTPKSDFPPSWKR